MNELRSLITHSPGKRNCLPMKYTKKWLAKTYNPFDGVRIEWEADTKKEAMEIHQWRGMRYTRYYAEMNPNYGKLSL